MEQPSSGPTETLLGKRKSVHSDEGNNSVLWGSTSSSLSAFCSANQGYGSPTVDNFKRSKQQVALCSEEQPVQHFWVWDHCMQQQPSPAGTQLQPADSSTAHTLANASNFLQQADHMDCSVADSRPGLSRTSSAPELLKLAQADSAAWNAQHQSQQQAAYLSHRDYWLT